MHAVLSLLLSSFFLGWERHWGIAVLFPSFLARFPIDWVFSFLPFTLCSPMNTQDCDAGQPVSGCPEVDPMGCSGTVAALQLSSSRAGNLSSLQPQKPGCCEAGGVVGAPGWWGICAWSREQMRKEGPVCFHCCPQLTLGPLAPHSICTGCRAQWHQQWAGLCSLSPSPGLPSLP